MTEQTTVPEEGRRETPSERCERTKYSIRIKLPSHLRMNQIIVNPLNPAYRLIHSEEGLHEGEEVGA